jgi:outer membrane protein assembly factor BamB
MKNFLYTALLFLSFSLPAQTLDWNTGLGGNSSRNALSDLCGPETNEVLWENGQPSVIAFQAMTDSNIVATSRIFDLANTLYGTDIVAQDILSGDTLWTTQLPVDFPDTDWRSRVSAMRDGVIYATRSGNTNYTYLYALDAADGSILWKSEDLINEGSTETAAFAANGDLIYGNKDNILRIDHLDGSTVWSTPRSAPTSNGQAVAVYEGKGYYWEASPFGPELSVIDLETGAFQYSSYGLLGLIQQVAPFVGPDGTVYAPRTQNNPVTDTLFAFTDTGNSLEKKWAIPLAYVPFATFGVGPDGAVYSYSRMGRVLRLNPETGAATDSSTVILTEGSPSPRIAIGANGIIYLTNDDGPNSLIYSFNPDLTVRWADPLPNVNTGGPAIGMDGTLIVCGIGNTVRAYEGVPCPVQTKDIKEAENTFSLFPNPAQDWFVIKTKKQTDGRASIYDQLGRVVKEVVLDNNPETRVDVSNLAPGSYLIVMEREGGQVNRHFIIQR